ncbi:hypothetical protein N0V83_000941 [Neocucurbitaria cava]|uniref:Uncharacterized protein n=1 Tax=Neocucurbitaria cava TaxID=798079 RepID=A0A9W8YI90_9PLEO|nr:hypothetical protein N0V83_000941 [Neocucurbitaria cava]
MSATTTRTFVPLTSNQAYVCTVSPNDLFHCISEVLRPCDVKYAVLQDIAAILKENIVTPQLPSDARFIPIKSTSRSRHKSRSDSRSPGQSFMNTAAGIAKNYTSRTGHKYARLPESVNQSFYFHHTEPAFQKVFPHADLSTYNSRKPVKQEVPQVVITSSTIHEPPTPRILSPSIVITAPDAEPVAEETDVIQSVEIVPEEAKIKVEEEDEAMTEADDDDEVAIHLGPPIKVEAMSEAAEDIKPPHDAHNPAGGVQSLPGPSSQVTDSAYGTQDVASYPQELVGEVTASSRGLPGPSKPRRSLRLAKKSAPGPNTSSTPSPALGKRSLWSDETKDDEPTPKRARR